MKFNVSPGMRIVMLLCLFILFFVILSVAAAFLTARFGVDNTPVMRIMTLMQSVFVFIAPAVITAVVITRQPARLLCIDSLPTIRQTLLAVATLIVAIPAMNAVIAWNESISLPPALEEAMKQSELAAREAIKVVIGAHNIPSLLVALMIVGVMAGLSEELFFRGALQRILSTGRLNIHVAIWLSAILFSALHMQIYGFVPRMLLGAFFGYMLYWTGSLWLPVMLHVLNNSIYLIGNYMTGSETQATLPSGADWAFVAVSVILTAAGLYLIRRQKTAQTV